MMGIFSLYCGMIYSDFSSVPVVLFNSCYKDFKRIKGCVYPFGIDHVWFNTQNEIVYTNDFKMKFSIIIGVFVMFVGLIIKLINSLHMKKKIETFIQFPLQLILFSSILFNVSCLIIVSWVREFKKDKVPSIINTLINLSDKEGIYFNRDFTMKINIIMISLSVVSLILLLIMPIIYIKFTY